MEGGEVGDLRIRIEKLEDTVAKVRRRATVAFVGAILAALLCAGVAARTAPRPGEMSGPEMTAARAEDAARRCEAAAARVEASAARAEMSVQKAGQIFLKMQHE
jgi:hypothetical protein